MYLVLLRHGESVWNKENRFTGWTDVELSDKGKREAQEAGVLLRNNNYKFDKAFTSVLKRATDTLLYVLKELDEKNIPISYSWKLNERHYGALQGFNKDEMRVKYGEEQVHLWRRSADVRPPQLTKDDDRYPGNDPKYKSLSEDEMPLSECLLDTMKRTIEYYNSNIIEELKLGKNILIVAHGNSLRSLVKYLEKVSDEDIMKIEIPTGKPYVYKLDDNLNIVDKFYL